MNTVDSIMALADRYAFHIPGSQHSDEARAVLLAALQEQAREGVAVANSAILARGRFHAFKGEDGEPDDWEWFEEGTNCEHGCIDAVIVRADAIAAPQPAQPSEPAQPEQGEQRYISIERVEGFPSKLEDGPQPVLYSDSINGCMVRRDDVWLALTSQLQSAQPVALPLTVDVCFIDGDDPFICTVHGKITVDALSEIEADIHENPDFGKGDGVYSYNVTRFNGQYGFEGRCELPPGWELDEIGYEPITAAHGIGGKL